MSTLSHTLRLTRLGFRRFLRQGRIDPLPVRHDVKGYTLRYAGYDLKAAVDVAMVGLPQGMAFAAMAGLDSIYGIMAATVGTFIAPLFSRCSLTVSGPSNATAFMLASFFLASSPEIHTRPMIFVPLIVFMAGLLCVIGAFAKATELLQFVSRSVLVGYVTGAATLIIDSQTRHVLGLEDIRVGSTFFSMCAAIVCHLGQIRWEPILLSGLTFALFFLLKRYFRFLPTFAIILLLMSLLNALLLQPWAADWYGGVRMLKDFSLEDLVFAVPEFGEFHHHVSVLVPVIVGIAFLSTLEQAVMSRTISAKTREPMNLNQDTFAVGLANMGSALTTSLPCSASLTRSALNYNSGAKTRFSGIYCGLLCLVITLLLAKHTVISHIPHCVLASLVLANAVSLYDKKLLRICFLSTPGDAAVLVVTFVASLLLPLHIAIFVGVVVSVSLFLRKAARPELVEYTFDDRGALRAAPDDSHRKTQISIVHVEGDLFFGAADLFRQQVNRIAEDPDLSILILRMRNARNLDASAVCALEELIRFMREQNRHIIISGASREVLRILKRSGVYELLQQDCAEGQTNIFLVEARNLNMSTRKALQRAQELLGGRHAEISIYGTEKAQAQ